MTLMPVKSTVVYNFLQEDINLKWHQGTEEQSKEEKNTHCVLCESSLHRGENTD